MTDDWEQRAAALAAGLVAGGQLRDPRWRAAFERTPRHVFVPRYYADAAVQGGWEMVDGTDPARHGEWLDAVYSDDVLITQTAPPPPPAWAGPDFSEDLGSDLPTSSSTAPCFMAEMLELLDIEDGHRVLEIGTATGYNAALLCHRLGSANVASIDIDAGLVDVARERLASVGHTPTLAAGDGANGLPGAAPFDRIIATCAVRGIPAAWIEQTRVGGLILADLRGHISGGLVLLRKVEPDRVEGRFRTVPVAFMPLRLRADNPRGNPGEYDRPLGGRTMYGSTTVDPRSVADIEDFRFALQLHLPGSGGGFVMLDDDDDGKSRLDFSAADGSSADVEVAASERGWYLTRQSGPRRLWDTVQAAWDTWNRTGRPGPERFGVTAWDTYQYAWLDDPEGDHSWLLPPLDRRHTR